MKKTSIKNLIIIIVAVVALLVLYVIFVKPDDSGSSSALTSSNTGSSPLQSQASQRSASSTSDSLLRILNNLQGLELNDSIFFNPAFDELSDISIPLVKEGNAGRRNPFAPIGNDPVPLPVNNGSVGEDISDSEEGVTETSDSEEDTAEEDSDDSGFGIFGF